MNTFEVLEAARLRLEDRVSNSLFIVGDRALAPTPNRIVTGRLYLENVKTVPYDVNTRTRETRIGLMLEVLSQQAQQALILLEEIHVALDAYEVPGREGRFLHLETRWVRTTPTVWSYQALFLWQPY